MFEVSFCFPSSLQNGNHHPALYVGSEENGKIHPLNGKPNIQAEKTSSRASAPHLRSMTIIFMLMCKIFQDLEPPHTCLLAGHQGDRRGCSFSLGAPQVTNSRLQMARDCHPGEQDCKDFDQHRPEKEEVSPHYLAKVLLQLQIKAALSRYLRAGLSQRWSSHHSHHGPKY